MTSLPNRQKLQVNSNALAGKLNAATLFNNKVHGFWEEILDKPVNSRVDTELPDSDNAAELNGSVRQLESLMPVDVSDHRTSAEALTPAAGSTNSTQQLDLFQVGLELLQERLALN